MPGWRTRTAEGIRFSILHAAFLCAELASKAPLYFVLDAYVVLHLEEVRYFYDSNGFFWGVFHKSLIFCRHKMKLSFHFFNLFGNKQEIHGY